MTWSWRYDDDVAAGAALPAQEAFTSQSDAETWLGEQWRDLLGAGVRHVTLLDDGAVVYPMSLEPAG